MWYCMGLVLLEVYCTLFCYCVIVYAIPNMWWCMYWCMYCYIYTVLYMKYLQYVILTSCCICGIYVRVLLCVDTLSMVLCVRSVVNVILYLWYCVCIYICICVCMYVCSVVIYVVQFMRWFMGCVLYVAWYLWYYVCGVLCIVRPVCWWLWFYICDIMLVLLCMWRCISFTNLQYFK